MDSILKKAKQGISKGFEEFLKHNYDGQVIEQQVIDFDMPTAKPEPIVAKPVEKPAAPERSIAEKKTVVKQKPFPQITWYILRCKYKKDGVKEWVVVIKHGRIKEEFDAIEWLKLKDFDPTLTCFVAAVVSAVKPESEFEPRVLEALEYS